MLKLLSDRILVEVEDTKKESKTSSGIILKKESVQPESRGKVIKVGTGRILEDGQRIKPEVEVDNEIVFTPFSGTEVIYEDGKEGYKYIILRETDILMVYQN